MSTSKLLAIIVWLGLAVAVYMLADSALNPNRASQLGDAQSVTLQRGLDGHYRAEALINGQKVDVLVDTGATGVAISEKTAKQLGLRSNTAIGTTTANGNAVAYLTRLESVKLGGVEARDVSATIAPGLEGDALLGMSFLGRMDVRLYKGEMTIQQIPE